MLGAGLVLIGRRDELYIQWGFNRGGVVCDFSIFGDNWDEIYLRDSGNNPLAVVGSKRSGRVH